MQYVNMNKKLKNGGRKTTDGSMESLKAALLVKMSELYDDNDFLSIVKDLTERFKNDWDDQNGSILFELLTDMFYSSSQLYKDISKINFDLENMIYESKDGLGFETLPNGLAVLKILAGGDWELPVFFVIYFDGKKLRAYVPAYGNCYNADTKEAFGNNDQADEEFLRKQGVTNIDEVEANIGACLKDVMSRIEII